MKMVRQGYSWSGSEKNRFFRNDGKGHYYEMSHLSGLDQAEDGRGLALVDWDHDGRIDLWYRNRNAPRLRFMHNQTASPPSLSLKLQGTKSNRDAIGATVELLPSQDDLRLIRSVRAGDLFLSQSSKWLHFSGHDLNSSPTARVTWPGGKTEDFQNLPTQGRLLLIEGSAKAQALPTRPAIHFPKSLAIIPPRDSGIAEIILPARLPFPQLRFQDSKGKKQTLQKNGKPKIVILWSPECPHCQKLIPTLPQENDNLEVIALAPPDTAGESSANILEEGSMQSLHDFQKRLFDRTPAPTVPLAIILDEYHQAVALYRGPMEIKTLFSEWQKLRSLTLIQRYHLAPPLKGTWFTNPLPPREVYRLFPAPKITPEQK